MIHVEIEYDLIVTYFNNIVVEKGCRRHIRIEDNGSMFLGTYYERTKETKGTKQEFWSHGKPFKVNKWCTSIAHFEWRCTHNGANGNRC